MRYQLMNKDAVVATHEGRPEFEDIGTFSLGKPIPTFLTGSPPSTTGLAVGRSPDSGNS